MTLRLATWNINSIRLRLDTIRRMAEEVNPDIICLQEIKVEDGLFPLDALHQMGFKHTVFAGQKSYNGVAMLSKIPLDARDEGGFGGKVDKRHLSVRLPNGVTLHNFYVPAGGDIPDVTLNDKFAHKLKFVDDMAEYFSQVDRRKAGKSILVGDFNIAPGEHDVWSHKQLLNVVSHTPIEVEKLANVQKSQNWVDAGRLFTPANEKLYSWWSYRNRDWDASNRGRRLDHIWVSPDLKDSVKAIQHLRELRGWVQPSDHVPVVADLKLS